MNIDVSTHEILEKVYNSLNTTTTNNNKLTLDNIIEIWYSIGHVIKTQLTLKKGVKLISFGTFTLTDSNIPFFSVSLDLKRQFKLNQKILLSSSSLISTTNLNFSQVIDLCTIKYTRDIIDKIYSKFLSSLGRFIYEGRNISISIHTVGEIKISKNELTCDFLPQFMKVFNSDETKKLERIQYLKSSGNSNNNIDNNTNNNTNNKKNQQSSDNNIDRYPIKGAGVRPRSAGYDPITGVMKRSMSAIAIGRGGGGGSDRGGRPSSAQSNRSSLTNDSNSIMFSPRQQLNSNINKSNNIKNNRHNMNNTRVGDNNINNNNNRSDKDDARMIAARAIGANDIIDKIRKKIIERGGTNGFRSMTRLLSIMDNNGDKTLSKDELKYGLRDYGIDLTMNELEQVLLYFDRDHSGTISIDEFLIGLKGDMNIRRKQIVRMAFDILDTDHSGIITIDEIMSKYDFNYHPDVRSGKKTIKEAAKDFMLMWDRKDKDGCIYPDEFEDYYNQISVGIDDDDQFELMIRNSWRISGGVGMAANTANRRVLITNKDGSQSIQTIQNELGMKAGDVNDARQRLAQQGIDASDIAFYGGVDNTDKKKMLRNNNSNRSNSVPNRTSNNNNYKVTSNNIISNTSNNKNIITNNKSKSPMENWLNEEESITRHNNNTINNNTINYSNHNQYNQRLSSSQPVKQQQGSSSPSSSSSSSISFDILNKLLYSPPISIVAFCTKLQVSAVSSAPRIAKGAFITRYIQYIQQSISLSSIFSSILLLLIIIGIIIVLIIITILFCKIVTAIIIIILSMIIIILLIIIIIAFMSLYQHHF
jgi:Ca2+-binding EF-hand superfamily protein